VYDFTRTYGVEIENLLPGGMSHAQLAQALSRAGILNVQRTYGQHRAAHQNETHWEVTTDISVQPDPMRPRQSGQGAEVVSPILRGPQGLEQVERVCRVLGQQECWINSTAGLHVHVGVRAEPRLSQNGLRRLALLYAESEVLLDSVLPPSRRDSRCDFARSIKHVANEARRLANADNIHTLQRVLEPGGGKFVKLNFLPMLTKGTVEFRHHSGTTDFNKIAMWVSACQRFVDLAHAESTVPVSAATIQRVLQARVRPGSKMELIYNLLTREEGATREQILHATGWRAVTVPGVAADLGLALSQHRVFEAGHSRRVFRYHGTPMTQEQRVEAASDSVTPSNVSTRAASIEELCDRLQMNADEKAYFLSRAAFFAAPTLAMAQPTA
jgi:hypothetical protein